MTAPVIRALVGSDGDAVLAIYREGIESGNATFETEVPTWSAWHERHLSDCRFVALVDGTVAGWAALLPVSPRPVYAGVAEVSIYIGRPYRGRGVGRALMTRLVAASEDAGIWTLQAGIFPENRASLTLHEAVGFRVVGRRERVGAREGRWRDVVLLERRSGRVGTS